MNDFKRISNLENHVAVIVGGSGQIGSSVAMRLAEKGARIVCLVKSKNVQAANLQIANLPKVTSGNHLVFEADILDSGSLKRASQSIQSTIGQCDILINAAGTTQNIKPGSIDELTDEIFDRILDTNLRGVFATIREFHGLLKKSGRGVIINISSTAALRASQSNVAYAAAKAGLNMLTKTLAKAFAPDIRVIAIAPGYLENATSGAIKSENFNLLAAETCPLKRIGYAEDIANTIEVCLTTIRFATGSIFVVDGGRTL